MKIRRFYGKNVRVALRAVTEEFGEDAAILSNKKVPGGVEIIAALDYDESLMPRRESDIQIHEASLTRQNSDEQSAHSFEPLSKNLLDKGLSAVNDSTPQLSKGFSQRYQQALNNQPASFEPNVSSDKEPMAARSNAQRFETPPQSEGSIDTQAKLADLIANNRVEWSMDPSLQAMREELGLMRNMMQEQLKGLSWNRFAEVNPMSAMLIRRLTRLGLNKTIIEAVLGRVSFQGQNDAECVWQQTLAILAKSIPVGDDRILDKGGCYALLGPTGVGKTTTIAKLAARFVIKHGHDSVALITTDNYRISAFEQLATFGRILKLPTVKTSEHEPLPKLLARFANKKLILIDTAGVSSNDATQNRQFEEIVAAGNQVQPVLLMSASSQAAVIKHSLGLFSLVKPQRAILTKLDEAACLGEVLSILIAEHLPVDYTTDGQRVPEDIRVARSHHLVSKAVWLANKFEREVDDWALAQKLNQPKLA